MRMENCPREPSEHIVSVILGSTIKCSHLFEISTKDLEVLQVAPLDQKTRFAKQAVFNQALLRIKDVQQHVSIDSLRSSEQHNFEGLGDLL